VKLQVLQVALVGFGALGREDEIVLAPHNNIGGWCSRK
jgi:hypothetical protein